jgi:type IV pilus assembly protein PilM
MVSMSAASSISRFFSAFVGRSHGGNALLAIDVAVNAVRAIHVRRDGGDLVLDGFRVLRGAGSASGQALEEALREAVSLRRGSEAVAVSVNSSDASIRRIDLPPMNPKELRESLQWEARRHIAGLPEDAVLDAHVLGGPGHDARAAAGPMAVVLVAFPRQLYESLEAALDRFRAEPVFIDVSPLAAMNGLVRREDFTNGPLALLDLGSASGSFSIFSADDLLLFRDLGQRVAQMDQTLANQFALDPEQLETLKLTGKLPKGETPNPVVLQRALGNVTAELVEDVRSALLFLESRAGTALEHVYVSGGNAALLERCGITESISVQTGVPLERWNPLQTFRIGLVDEIALRACASELSALAGLAARFFRGN